MVVNGTGLGKNGSGSPLTDAVGFPEKCLVWGFNYRGNLVFFDQARAQEKTWRLQIVDGWTRVVAEVFDVDIPVDGPLFIRTVPPSRGGGRHGKWSYDTLIIFQKK